MSLPFVSEVYRQFSAHAGLLLRALVVAASGFRYQPRMPLSLLVLRLSAGVQWAHDALRSVANVADEY